MNDHRSIRELLGAYALDQLAPHERPTIDAHLSGCPECRAELAEIVPVAQSLRLVDPDRLGDPLPSPPADLGDTILARIRIERGRRIPRWLLPVAAAVAAVALGVGVGWWAHPDLPQVPLEPVAVSGPDTRITADANLVPHTWGVEIKLTASGFESGAAYQVVVKGADGQRFPAGEFVGTGAKEMKCNLNSSILREQAVGFEVTDSSGAVVLRSTF